MNEIMKIHLLFKKNGVFFQLRMIIFSGEDTVFDLCLGIGTIRYLKRFPKLRQGTRMGLRCKIRAWTSNKGRRA